MVAAIRQQDQSSDGDDQPQVPRRETEGSRKCDWCPTMTKDVPAFEDPKGYYQAWDWYVCRGCFLDLEE